jgi:hypothetical protein
LDRAVRSEPLVRLSGATTYGFSIVVVGGIGGEKYRSKRDVRSKIGADEAQFRDRSKPWSRDRSILQGDRHTSGRRVEAHAEGTQPS